MTDNRTAYAAGHAWIRDRDGAHHWIVAVKATFMLRGRGRLDLADEQVPALLAPEYNREDFVSSIRFEADLTGPKPGTDVIVNGSAYAPHGRPAGEVPVSLRVDGLQKVLLVRGVNVYHSAAGVVRTSRPRPFERMPVIYEQAFGGFDQNSPDPAEHRLDPRNPIGVGFATKTAHLVDTPGPNVVYPGQDPRRAGPAGFGVIASHWMPRLRYAGTYDAKWIKERRPLLPADYDDRFVMASPEDQRLPNHLRGGARIEIVNMTPEGVLSFDLPRIWLAFRTHIRGRAHEHRSRLTTVVVEPDERRLLMTWQSSLRVRPKDIDYLDRTVVQEKPYVQ